MNNSPIRNEAAFLFHSANMCREFKSGDDGAWQVAPFQCSIPYTSSCLDQVSGLKEQLRFQFPELIEFGEKRARRAYRYGGNTITKPSYISRIKNFNGTGLDQVASIQRIARSEPYSGGLVFSVFSPDDLILRKRPGYVPCLISGSFLLHEDELQLNAFFRSQSVVEFGIFDLEFLRRLQIDVAESLCGNGSRKRKIRTGSLNLHFGRIIIQRRLMRNRDGFFRRDEVLDGWLRSVERFCMETEYN